jgi:hypothetical protein
MTSPSAGLATHYSDVAVRLKDLLIANMESLGIDSIFYGDQDLVPNGITVCVQPGTGKRELQGAQHMTLNTLVAYILVYVSKIQDIQQNRLTADLTCKAIVKLLHNNLRLTDADGLNPILVHGFVEEDDPGYTIRKGTLFESVKMTFTGTTKTMLGL